MSATEMQVKERPILFSGPMVRAILAGRKTQTRRISKHEPLTATFGRDNRLRGPVGASQWGIWSDEEKEYFLKTFCPYGVVGDRMWVREAWRTDRCYDHIKPCDLKKTWPIYYESDITDGYHKRRPSIHMPRWASRITLEITNVRIERLQSITPEGLTAEGFPPDDSPPHDGTRLTFHGRKLCFAELWDGINGADSWDANPWVWVIEFKKL